MITMKRHYFEKWVKSSIAVMMIVITALAVFGVASYFYFTHHLPSIETLKNYKPSTITKIFSEEGAVIGEFFYEKREVISLDRVPNHLNQIDLGHGAYGIAAAAENYFGKNIEALSIAESALLAGLPQAPSKYSPYQHPEQAQKRQVYVLNRMVEEGFISF